jgi:AraC-like DNA-binding protein
MVEIFDNIRGAYLFAAPCAELAPYVEFFAESVPAAAQDLPSDYPYAGTMFASWTPTCYVNLGPAYQLDLAQARYHVGAGADVLLLRNQTVVRHIPAADHLFVLKFHPGGLHAVLGVSQVGLADRLVSLGQVLPPALLAQVRAADSFAARTDLVQRHLLAAQRARPVKDHYHHLVGDALGIYQQGGLQLRTAAVAARACLSSKTITRYFQRVVGTSAKQYLSLLQARTALTAWVASPATFAPEDYGYYDQSHFRKAVRQFTGRALPRRPPS